jgi:hypothetical protein
MKFLGPGSRNAAGLFLKKLNEKLKDHAAGSLARSSIRSSARTGTRFSRPILMVGISPRAAAS